MGTFLSFYGDNTIKNDKLEEYIERVKKIISYGGMVQFEEVKMFDEKPPAYL